MRGRRFKTQADIERYIAQGYGQGQGAEYVSDQLTTPIAAG